MPQRGNIKQPRAVSPGTAITKINLSTTGAISLQHNSILIFMQLLKLFKMITPKKGLRVRLIIFPELCPGANGLRTFGAEKL